MSSSPSTPPRARHFGQLVRKGILNTFALAYVDENRSKLLSSYAGPDAFRKQFVVDAALIKELKTRPP